MTGFSVSVFLNLTIRKCFPQRRYSNPAGRLSAKLKVGKQKRWELKWNCLSSWEAKGLYKSRPYDRISSYHSWSFVMFFIGWLQIFTVKFWETERANERGTAMRLPSHDWARKWSYAKSELVLSTGIKMPSATLMLFYKSWLTSSPKYQVPNDKAKCLMLRGFTVVICPCVACVQKCYLGSFLQVEVVWDGRTCPTVASLVMHITGWGRLKKIFQPYVRSWEMGFPKHTPNSHVMTQANE